MQSSNNDFSANSAPLSKAFRELQEVLTLENIVTIEADENPLANSLNNLGYLVGSYDDFFNSLSRTIGVLALADLDFAKDELEKLYGKCEMGDAIAGALNMFVMLLQRGQRIYTPDSILRTLLKPNSFIIVEDATGRVAYVNTHLKEPYNEKFKEELNSAPGDSIQSLLLMPSTEELALLPKADKQTFSGFVKFFEALVPCTITRQKFRKTEYIYFVELNNFSES